MVQREALSSGQRPRFEAKAPDAAEGPSAPVVRRDLIGAVLGDFEVETRIGRGGMGEVYRARQISLGRPVALKVLKPDLIRDPTSRARLESEAMASARLSHPNIVHVYAYGESQGHAFLAMEYVPGTNLRAYLDRHGPPELSRAFSMMRQATSAVAAAGEAGLVHRDLKPENLLLNAKGQVKVADFGLCKVRDSDRVDLTAPGLALGTPLYNSPEQVQGLPVDCRSDLYSLGATFYHLLTGRPPFQADGPLALALRHVREAPIPPDQFRPEIPVELSDLILRLLAKDPADRYPSGSELGRDLAVLREWHLAGATTRRLVLTPIEQPDPAASHADRAAVRSPRFGRFGWRLGVPTVLAGLMIGTVLGYLIPPTPPPPMAQPTMPALGIDDWRSVPERATAIEQYRYAQLIAPRSGRLAAWLAVPGRFPDRADVAYRAYVQLARDLLRDGDAPLLADLAEEIEDWASERSDGPLWNALASVARAGSDALEDEAMAARARFQALNVEGLDPAVAELAFECVAIARRSASGIGPESEPLARLASDLLAPARPRRAGGPLPGPAPAEVVGVNPN